MANSNLHSSAEADIKIHSSVEADINPQNESIIFNLPNETIEHICGYVNAHGLVRFMQTCKLANQLLSKFIREFEYGIFYVTFPEVDINLYVDAKYSRQFLQCIYAAMSEMSTATLSQIFSNFALYRRGADMVCKPAIKELLVDFYATKSSNFDIYPIMRTEAEVEEMNIDIVFNSVCSSNPTLYIGNNDTNVISKWIPDLHIALFAINPALLAHRSFTERFQIDTRIGAAVQMQIFTNLLVRGSFELCEYIIEQFEHNIVALFEFDCEFMINIFRLFAECIDDVPPMHYKPKCMSIVQLNEHLNCFDAPVIKPVIAEFNIFPSLKYANFDKRKFSFLERICRKIGSLRSEFFAPGCKCLSRRRCQCAADLGDETFINVAVFHLVNEFNQCVSNTNANNLFLDTSASQQCVSKLHSSVDADSKLHSSVDAGMSAPLRYNKKIANIVRIIKTIIPEFVSHETFHYGIYESHYWRAMPKKYFDIIAPHLTAATIKDIEQR